MIENIEDFILDSMNDKIYVRFIDGMLSVEPVNARQISDEVYEILPDHVYINLDRCEMYEFYPGDIVKVEPTENLDDDYLYHAKSLIYTPDPEERLYREFLFYSMTYQIPTEQGIQIKYKSAINRIKSEMKEGLFVYKRTRRTIELIERFLPDVL